jgi:hypothetical protein
MFSDDNAKVVVVVVVVVVVIPFTRNRVNLKLNFASTGSNILAVELLKLKLRR